MNNLENLMDDLKKREEEFRDMGSEHFAKDMELTEEEKKVLAEISDKPEVVVTETSPDGGTVTTPIKAYAAPLDDRVKTIHSMKDQTDAMIKTVNAGDIKETLEDAKKHGREQALKTFRQLTVKDDTDIGDDEIFDLNDQALKALMDHFHMERIGSDDITRKLMKMSLQDIVRILPAEFVETYVNAGEIRANNYKAKERLITTIAYLTAAGPELDYLNEYIENEHRLMRVSHQILECQMDMSEVIQKPEKLSEIVSKMHALDPTDVSFWQKHIHGDPRKVHNEFARNAVICQEYKTAYEKLAEQFEGDEQALALVQEQIDECDTKYAVYTSVTKLELMKSLMVTLTERFKNDKKNNYKNLEREAIAAIERIRKSKANVPFPIYDAKLAKKPAELFKLYMAEFPAMIHTYNKAMVKLIATVKTEEERNEARSRMIYLEGIPDEFVASYFSLLLLILYGRIMKKLTPATMTKYNAIELDAYFNCYCKLGTDVYLMSEFWEIMKDFTEYAIHTWPKMGK